VEPEAPPGPDNEAAAEVAERLRWLPRRTRRLLEGWFGIGQERRSTSQPAAEYRISTSRVQQFLKKAICKLRRLARAEDSAA
jgi:DNA-directed RNA polymerase sigma subunit (sigma70/sigma32)